MKNKIIVTFLLFIITFPCLLAQDMDQIYRWKFGVSGGMGFRTGSFKDAKKELMDLGIDRSTANSFYDRQKWARTLDVQAYYLFKPTWGLGLKYNFSNTSAKKEDIFVQSTSLNQFMDIEQRNYFHFVGPSFYAQQWINSNRNLLLVSNISIGYTHYREEDEAGYSRLLATGHSFGSICDIGLEYFFHKNWSIGVDLSYFSSSLFRIKIEDAYESTTLKLKGNDRISLDRLDLTFGIRFYK